MLQSCHSMKPYKTHSWDQRESQNWVCLQQSSLPEQSSVSCGWHCDGVTTTSNQYFELWNKCDQSLSVSGQTQPWLEAATGQQTKYSQILMRICPAPAPAIVIHLPAHQIMMGQLQDVILCTLIHRQDNIQLPCLTQWAVPWQNTFPSWNTWIQTMLGKIT